MKSALVLDLLILNLILSFLTYSKIRNSKFTFTSKNKKKLTSVSSPARLIEVNHPDHTLITYPNLGHLFYPSSQWSTGIGPFEPYVLPDIYSWLEAHSGFTNNTTNNTTITDLSMSP
ncbi:MAG: hypothetical protein WCC17_11030 [Candidatus Nitrosopolaris sp.]